MKALFWIFAVLLHVVTACPVLAANPLVWYGGLPGTDGVIIEKNRPAARAFHLHESAEVTMAEIPLKRVSGETGWVVVELYDDSVGVPGRVLASAMMPAQDVPADGDYHWLSFTWSGVTLAADVRHWIVVSLAYDSNALLKWRVDLYNQWGDATDAKASWDNGYTWPTTLNSEPYFRVYGTRSAINADITLSTSQSSVSVGGTTTLFVTIKDTNGSLVKGRAPVQLTLPSGSTLGHPLEWVDDGYGAVPWTAPTATGECTITANFSDYSASGNDYLSTGPTYVDVDVTTKDTSTTTALTLSKTSIHTREQIDVSAAVTYIKDELHPNEPVPDGAKVTFSGPANKGEFPNGYDEIDAWVMNGTATTTWTAQNQEGDFLIEASYPGQTTGAVKYGASEDTESVRVDYCRLPTNTRVRVSPDRPYVGQKAWVEVRVTDDSGNPVPIDTVNFLESPGWFESTKVTMRDGLARGIWHAPATPGDVDISAEFVESTCDGNTYYASSGYDTVTVTNDAEDGGGDMSCYIEWNTNYWLPLSTLEHSGIDAHAFRDKLKSAGWNWDQHFNDNSLPSHLGSDDDTYADKHDFVYFHGHGSPFCLWFSDGHGRLNYWDALLRWGNEDMDWIALFCCETMSWHSEWAGTMNGVHLECGFHTKGVDSVSFGQTFAGLLTKEGIHDEPHPVCQSWFLAADTDLDLWLTLRVIGPTEEMFEDYVWGQGHVADDPSASSTYHWISHDVIAGGSAPVAEAGGPYYATVGQPVQLDASATTDPDLPWDHLYYIWDMDPLKNADFDDWDNDGTDDLDDDKDACGPTTWCLYDEVKTYTVRLIVRDTMWNVGTDTATIYVRQPSPGPGSLAKALEAPPGSPPVIVNRYTSLPGDPRLPTFKTTGAPIGFNELMSIAMIQGVQETADLDSSGTWNMVDGSKELTVNQYSGGVMFVDRDTAYRYTYPPGHEPGPLPDEADCAMAADAFLHLNNIGHDPAVLEHMENVTFGSGANGARKPDRVVPFQRRVNYRRQFNVMGNFYPAVGPGGKISVLLDEFKVAKMFVKVWRDAQMEQPLELLPAQQAVNAFHQFGAKVLIGNGIIPACNTIRIDRVSIGYYEYDFNTPQDMIYPVYVLDLTCEDDTSSVAARVYMPALSPPIQATITSPPDGTEIDYGQPITFTGAAQGGIGPFTYEWSSDKDGVLGCAPTLTTNSLSVTGHGDQPTRHAIRFKVTDSCGWSVYDYIWVKVRPRAITEAKCAADGTTLAALGPVVTLSYPDYFYVEKPDRSSGIWVISAARPPESSTVTVYGVMDTQWEERCIVASGVEVLGQTDPIESLGTNILSIGGGDFGVPPLGQKGVGGGTGLNNIGLLMRTAGNVDWVSEDRKWFVLSDGSAYQTYCLVPAGVQPPSGGQFCAVTGVSSIGYTPEKLWRMLLIRRQSDINIVPRN